MKYSFGHFVLDTAGRRLARRGCAVPLKEPAFDVLARLVGCAGEVVSRAALLHDLSQSRPVRPAALTRLIGQVREALQDRGSDARYLETVRGCGYRFVAPVTADKGPGGSHSPRGSALAHAGLVHTRMPEGFTCRAISSDDLDEEGGTDSHPGRTLYVEGSATVDGVTLIERCRPVLNAFFSALPVDARITLAVIVHAEPDGASQSG